jgi:hypothetical protein
MEISQSRACGKKASSNTRSKNNVKRKSRRDLCGKKMVNKAGKKHGGILTLSSIVPPEDEADSSELFIPGQVHFHDKY